MKTGTNRNKTVVLILSHHYPKTAIHAGKPTRFKQQLLEGRKIHTCRGRYDGWALNIDKVNDKGYVLSVREWDGKPYGRGVRQKVIREYHKAGYQRFTMRYDRATGELKCVIDGKRFTDIEALARNDGMTVEEFKDWFFGQGLNRSAYSGIIIHFTDFRYNSEHSTNVNNTTF
jgi:hypothetical protein